jgi:hypothetical protein
MLVRDSSLYSNGYTQNIKRLNGELKVGITKEVRHDDAFGCLLYLVEVTTHGLTYILNCRLMSRFGDAYNYEEWGRRSIHTPSPVGQKLEYSKKVGEVVLVAHIGGSTSDGVIVGSLSHPARQSKLQPNEIAYYSEFNGLETKIDPDGAYTVTFKGTPTTVSSLNGAAGSGKIPDPEYNENIAGSYLGFDSKGNFTVTDSGSKTEQSIKIDKSNGKTTITSGTVTLEISGSNKAISVTADDVKINGSKTFAVKSKTVSIEASDSAKLKASKVAIGYGSVELIDTLIKLIDAVGTLVVSSPVGPCSPIQTAPTWAQLIQIKTQLSSIKGSL